MMNEATYKRLEALAEDARKPGLTSGEIERWTLRAAAFIRQTLGDEAGTTFDSLKADGRDAELGLKLGHIEGLLAMAEIASSIVGSAQTRLGQTTAAPDSVNVVGQTGKRVFVVHGHDGEAKESVARFLQKIGLEPIILHEQASSGRTVIEKFETYSHGVAFAVVLLTADDVGAALTDASNLRARARQNVIMELGYFIGKLGRMRVCALHKGSLELPSDYQGVIYLEMDQGGAWKTKLAQELVQAKVTIELAGLLET